MADRVIAQVKWFNDKLSYGFVTRLDTGEDVFVHIGDIEPKWDHDSRATLYTGEYVTCVITDPNPDAENPRDTRSRALHVRGLPGADGEQAGLMCDFGRIRFQSYTKRHMSEESIPEEGVENITNDAPDDATTGEGSIEQETSE